MDGPVLQAFVFDPAHPYAGGQHRGIDIGAATGDPVRAPAGGVVSFAGTTPGNGLTLSVRTADGYTVSLTHLGSLEPHAGASVAEGDTVGTVGPSGTPELAVPYVHLGIRTTADPNGYVDPQSLLPVREAPPPALPPTLAGTPVVPEPTPAEPALPAAAAGRPGAGAGGRAPAPPAPVPRAAPAPLPHLPRADARAGAAGACPAPDPPPAPAPACGARPRGRDPRCRRAGPATPPTRPAGTAACRPASSPPRTRRSPPAPEPAEPSWFRRARVRFSGPPEASVTAEQDVVAEHGRWWPPGLPRRGAARAARPPAPRGRSHAPRRRPRAPELAVPAAAASLGDRRRGRRRRNGSSWRSAAAALAAGVRRAPPPGAFAHGEYH